MHVLDEPSAGLHPADVERLTGQPHALVEHGATVVVVEHGTGVVAGADAVLDLGPSGGDAGGRVVASGTPASVTAPCLAQRLGRATA